MWIKERFQESSTINAILSVFLGIVGIVFFPEEREIITNALVIMLIAISVIIKENGD